jgi:hypothetical protein
VDNILESLGDVVVEQLEKERVGLRRQIVAFMLSVLCVVWFWSVFFLRHPFSTWGESSFLIWAPALSVLVTGIWWAHCVYLHDQYRDWPGDRGSGAVFSASFLGPIALAVLICSKEGEFREYYAELELGDDYD